VPYFVFLNESPRPTEVNVQPITSIFDFRSANKPLSATADGSLVRSADYLPVVDRQRIIVRPNNNAISNKSRSGTRALLDCLAHSIGQAFDIHFRGNRTELSKPNQRVISGSHFEIQHPPLPLGPGRTKHGSPMAIYDKRQIGGTPGYLLWALAPQDFLRTHARLTRTGKLMPTRHDKLEQLAAYARWDGASGNVTQYTRYFLDRHLDLPRLGVSPHFGNSSGPRGYERMPAANGVRSQKDFPTHIAATPNA
jgi:hypothetical protein